MDDQPSWASQLPDVGAPASPDTDQPAWAAAMDHPSAAHAAPKVAAPSAPVHHAAPTRFHQAVAAPDEPELSWSDVGSQALKNAIPSAVGAGKSVVDAVMHPIKTATAIGDIGKGAASQVAGAFGEKQDPSEKAHNEALISALENHYKQQYGSVKGFKKAVATDPVSIAMDASTVLGGAGAGAEAAGLAKTAGVLGKTASAVDPVANAVRIAKIPAKIVAPVARQASAITTGIPASAMELATKVGAHPDPAVRAAYKKFVTGAGTATDFQQAAQSAVAKIRGDMSDAYLAKKGPMAQTPVDFGNTRKALADAYTKAQMGSRVGKVPKASMDALDEARQMVDDVANDPARNTIEHADALKQQLWDLKDHHKEVADNYLNGVYHGVRDDLISSDPEYASLMEKYQVARQNINDLTKTLGTGKNTAASTTLLKNLRALKTGTGENLLSQVMDKDPTIGAMLAGDALHPWHAGGRSAIEALLAAPAAGAIFSHPLAAAVSIPASLASSSPRLAGAANYGAGAASRLAEGAAMSPAMKAVYYGGRGEQENGEDAPAPADMDTAKKAVASVESDGSGGYSAMGPVVRHGGISDRALGKYQVMQSNVPKWTQAVLGRRMTSQEFLADPDAQEKVFEGVFGGYLKKYGNMRDALSAWHSGVPLSQAIAENRHDQNMSTSQYVKKAGFARGGATGNSHEQLVERLMKLAKAAKKGESESTESLLSMPDDAVAKALEVAQAAI